MPTHLQTLIQCVAEIHLMLRQRKACSTQHNYRKKAQMRGNERREPVQNGRDARRAAIRKKFNTRISSRSDIIEMTCSLIMALTSA